MPDGRVPFGVTAANTAAMTAEDGCYGWTALKMGPARSPAPPEPSTHHGQDPSVDEEKGTTIITHDRRWSPSSWQHPGPNTLATDRRTPSAHRRSC